MATKLTLRLDEHLVESAKEYSAKTGKSVSRIVADLFEIIQNEKLEKEFQATPATQSLRGVIKDKDVTEGNYDRYLEKKYL